MNTHDIELPPLPRPQVPRIDADLDLMDIRRLADWCEKTAKAYALAAIEPYAKRIAQLEAARFAYASEFPPNEDGDPDVGSIHENIRKLKAELEAHPQGRGGPAFAWYDPTTGLFTRNKDDPDSGIPAGSCLWPLYREAPTLHNSASGAPNADQAPQPAKPVAYGIKAANTGEIVTVLYGSDVDQVGEYRADLVVPLYTTPQPAESCASLMSDKTACRSKNGDCDSQPAEPVKKKDWNVELSSWSDEDFVQVFHECPDLADRLRRVLAEPSKGETVLYTSQKALDLISRSDAVISVGLTRVPRMTWNVPLYTAPQPAKPVKVPSDVRGDVARELQEANRHLEMPTARYYVDAVCDLLARYGHIAQHPINPNQGKE